MEKCLLRQAAYSKPEVQNGQLTTGVIQLSLTYFVLQSKHGYSQTSTILEQEQEKS